MNKMNKKEILNNFNIELNNNQTRIILTIVIILVIILLFKKMFNTIIEKIIVFTIIFLLFLVISKNLIITFIGTLIIFLLINLIIRYRTTVENFEDLKDSVKADVGEPAFDKSIFSDPKFLESSEGIQELLKKINGGIKLKEDDLKETDKINIDIQKYSDDDKPNPLKQAQKESYELINTVNALKDTITTLAPVLKEGKRLMGMFQNLSI
jgi:hypothetical protein